LPSSQEERRTPESRRIIDLDEEEEDEVSGGNRPTAHPPSRPQSSRFFQRFRRRHTVYDDEDDNDVKTNVDDTNFRRDASNVDTDMDSGGFDDHTGDVIMEDCENDAVPRHSSHEELDSGDEST
jgi:hypothetical protein